VRTWGPLNQIGNSKFRDTSYFLLYDTCKPGHLCPGVWYEISEKLNPESNMGLLRWAQRFWNIIHIFDPCVRTPYIYEHSTVRVRYLIIPSLTSAWTNLLQVSVKFPDTSPNSIGPTHTTNHPSALTYQLTYPYSGTSGFRSTIRRRTYDVEKEKKGKEKNRSEEGKEKKKRNRVRDDQSVNPWVSQSIIWDLSGGIGKSKEKKRNKIKKIR